MRKWPTFIPPDLEKSLATQEGFRDPPSLQDRWVEIRDWLIVHGVDAPEGLPVRAELHGQRDN